MQWCEKWSFRAGVAKVLSRSIVKRILFVGFVQIGVLGPPRTRPGDASGRVLGSFGGPWGAFLALAHSPRTPLGEASGRVPGSFGGPWGAFRALAHSPRTPLGEASGRVPGSFGGPWGAFRALAEVPLELKSWFRSFEDHFLKELGENSGRTWDQMDQRVGEFPQN